MRYDIKALLQQLLFNLQHVRLCCTYVVRGSYMMYIDVTLLRCETVMDMCSALVQCIMYMCCVML